LFSKHFKKCSWILRYFQKCFETFWLVYWFDLFSECSETFSLFRSIKICFGNITKVFQNIKTFLEVFRNILTCLVDCPIFKIFETFSSLRNIKICSENISSCLAVCPNCSIFQSVPKLLVCLKTFQSVMKYLKFVLKTFQKFIFETFQKCSTILRYFSKVFWNILTCLVNCSAFKMFWNFQFTPKHSDLFWEHFKNVLKIFQDCSNTFRFVFGIFRKCLEY